MFINYKWVKIEMAHRRFLPTRSFSKYENLNFWSPFSRKRCTGRYSTGKRNVLRIRFPSLVQSPCQRKRGDTFSFDSGLPYSTWYYCTGYIDEKAVFFTLARKSFAAFSLNFVQPLDLKLIHKSVPQYSYTLFNQNIRLNVFQGSWGDIYVSKFCIFW